MKRRDQPLIARVALVTALVFSAQVVLPPAALAYHGCIPALPGGTSPGQPTSPSGGQGPANWWSAQLEKVKRLLDPIDVHLGDFVLSRQDVFLPAGRGPSVGVAFSYRSRSGYNGPFGYGWDMAYNKRVVKLSNNNLLVWRGTNRRDEFAYDAGTGGYLAPVGIYDLLVRNGDGTYTLTSKHGVKEFYDTTGRLTKREDRNGNALTFSYDPGGLFSITGISAFFVNLFTGLIAKNDQLQRITDTGGGITTFTYNAEGRLSTISYAGRTITYGYDPNQTGDLLTVTMPATPQFPAGTTTTYAYDATHNLTAVTDPKNQPHLTNLYDSHDCLRQQTFGGGTTTVAYLSSATCPTTNGYGDPGYNLKLTPLVAAPGNSLTVSWTAPMGASLYDQIRLYQQGGTTNWASFYTNGATIGSGTLTVPASPSGRVEAAV